MARANAYSPSFPVCVSLRKIRFIRNIRFAARQPIRRPSPVCATRNLRFIRNLRFTALKKPWRLGVLAWGISADCRPVTGVRTYYL